MAELSKETLAILDRLKREGALTRNATSGNSIKQIMGKLDKFSVVFENINTQIAQMNKTFGQMLGANPSTFVGPLPSGATSSLEPTSVKIDVESLRAMGIDEETIALQKQAAELNIKNNLEDEKLRDETEKKRKEDDKDKRQKAKADEAAAMWRTKTISGQAMTNPLSFFTKLLKGAAIGFVGFNVVRGIVDQWTDGAFTKFVEDIDYAAIGEGIKTFTSFLSDSPWLGFSAALLAWTAIDFGVPLALNVTGEVIRTSMLAKMLNKGVMGGVEKSPGFLKTVLSLRGLALGALGVGIMVGGEKLADVVRSSISGMTPDQIKNEKLTVDAGDVVSTLGYAAGGATIGAMFGPQGALIGGVLGFAYGIGSKALEYMAASSMEKINFDELGEQQDRDKAIIAQQMLDEHAAGTRELSKAQLDAFKIQAQGPSQDRLDAVNNEIGDQRNVLGRQLKVEQRTRYIAFNPVEAPRDPFISSTGTIVTFVDSIPTLAQDTRPHMSAQTIEMIVDRECATGQSAIAMMRQERNQARLANCGIPLNNNLNDKMPGEDKVILTTNGTIEPAKEGITNDFGKLEWTNPAFPVNPGPSGPIELQPQGYYISPYFYPVVDLALGDYTDIITGVLPPTVWTVNPSINPTGDPVQTDVGGDGGAGGGNSGFGGGNAGELGEGGTSSGGAGGIPIGGGGGSSPPGGLGGPDGSGRGSSFPGSGTNPDGTSGLTNNPVIIRRVVPKSQQTINLNPNYIGGTLQPSGLSTDQAIEQVILCNCDCWDLI